MATFFWPATEAPFTAGTNAHDFKAITLGIKFRKQKRNKIVLSCLSASGLINNFYATSNVVDLLTTEVKTILSIGRGE